MPGEFHGQRSLAGYSPWDHKESDTTEWLSLFIEKTFKNVSIKQTDIKNMNMNKYKIYVNINIKICIKVLMKYNKIINKYRTRSTMRNSLNVHWQMQGERRCSICWQLNFSHKRKQCCLQQHGRRRRRSYCEVSREEKDKYHMIALVWNWKYNTYELIYHIKTDIHREQAYGFHVGRRVGEG